MKDLNFDYSIWDYKAKIRKTDRYKNELKPHPLTGEKFHYYTFNGGVRVYSLDLVYLFSDNNPIEAYNRTAKETIYLNSIDLYRQFEEGYIYGKQQFENEYKLTTKEMISADKDNLFTILRDKYFNAKTTLVGVEGGWRKILNRSPISIKKGTLEKYGYYSGLLTGLYEMIDQAPTIFEGFLDTPSTDTKDTTTNKIGRPLTEAKITAKYFALTSYFEAEAKIGENWIKKVPYQEPFERYWDNRTSEFEERFEVEKMPTGHTIRKAFDVIKSKHIDIFTINHLTGTYGDNWKQIVMLITNDKQKMDRYLKSINL